MLRSFIRNWILSAWKLPAIFCLVCVMAAAFIIIPLGLSAETRNILNKTCGWIFLLSFIGNAAHLLSTAVYYFLKLKNLRALWQILSCCTIWLIGVLLFMRIAVEADPPSPYLTEKAINTKQEQEAPQKATDTLLGPMALMHSISPRQDEPQLLAATPNLLRLEQEYPELLENYLKLAPKWNYTANDDTFYSKPGHIVMVSDATPDMPGIVHVAMRAISAGTSLPQGYTVIRPGEPLPEPTEPNKDEVPDLALELGGKRYLLLAWRGPGNKTHAFNAINAAISAIDAQFAALSKSPTTASMAHLLAGTDRIPGTSPELRFAQVPSQMGIYQAELYANPGQSGTLMMVIRDKKTGHPLRIFSQKAKYSDNKNELYRHDISPAMEAAYRRLQANNAADSIPEKAPFFYIKTGDSLSYFDITIEVFFSPANRSTHNRVLLLKNHYAVRPYEKEIPATPAISQPHLPSLPEPEEEDAPAAQEML